LIVHPGASKSGAPVFPRSIAVVDRLRFRVLSSATLLRRTPFSFK
jgi:hypothetical protein